MANPYGVAMGGIGAYDALQQLLVQRAAENFRNQQLALQQQSEQFNQQRQLQDEQRLNTVAAGEAERARIAGEEAARKAEKDAADEQDLSAAADTLSKQHPDLYPTPAFARQVLKQKIDIKNLTPQAPKAPNLQRFEGSVGGKNASLTFNPEQGSGGEIRLGEQVIDPSQVGPTIAAADPLVEQERRNNIALQNQQLKAGQVNQQDVNYWTRQVLNDPSQWNKLANNKALQLSVQSNLAANGKDINQLTMQSRQMAETAKEILPHISGIQNEAQELDRLGLMGPIAGRWRDFMAGTIGSGELAGGNPKNAEKIGKFRTDLGLLMTAVARAHGGARGGGSPMMLAHMKEIMDAQGKDFPTFAGALSGVRDWMEGYAGMMGDQGVGQSSAGTASSIKAPDFVFDLKTGTLKPKGGG